VAGQCEVDIPQGLAHSDVKGNEPPGSTPDHTVAELGQTYIRERHAVTIPEDDSFE